jgi:hypothetical protein
VGNSCSPNQSVRYGALFIYAKDLVEDGFGGACGCPSCWHCENFYLVRFMAEGLRQAKEPCRPPVPKDSIGDFFDCFATLIRKVSHCIDDIGVRSRDLRCNALKKLLKAHGSVPQLSGKVDLFLADMCAEHRTHLPRYLPIHRLFVYSGLAFAQEVTNVVSMLLKWADGDDDDGDADPDLVSLQEITRMVLANVQYRPKKWKPAFKILGTD